MKHFEDKPVISSKILQIKPQKLSFASEDKKDTCCEKDGCCGDKNESIPLKEDPEGK